MPRLPEALGTPQDLGAVSPDPSRIIPHYDAGQVGAAMQGFAGDLGASAGQIQDVQDRLSRAVAEQDFISRNLDLDQQFASDPDYSTAPQRYRQSLLQALNDMSRGILGPAQRADFQQQMSRFTESGVDTMLRQSIAKARDAGRANVTQAAGAAVNDALRTPDETNLNPIFNAINDRIQASMEAGYLSRDESVALRKSTAQSYLSQRGWRLADADPQQAVDTLKPTALGEDGQPSFAKTGDWRDLLDPGERMDMLRRSQQNLDMQQRAAQADALRRQRQQQKAESDAAQAITTSYLSQLATDPTSVDVAALAREKFPDSQQDTRQALLGAAESAIAQAGGPASYGPGFWQAFNRVTAPDGDPDKINDPVELLKLAGPEGGGALIQGVQQLQRFLDQNKTIEGRAQNAIEQNFLRQAHAAITGTEGAADPAAETRFQNFLGAYFPALDQGLKSGKSATQLLSAASSDYLGKLIPAFAPPPAQPAAAQPAQNAPAAPLADQLNAATASGRRDKDTGTPTDDRSLWQRFLDGFAAVGTGMNEEQQAARQGVNPGLTRDLARRLGTLDMSQDVPMVAPDDRGILEKPEVFAPWRMVALGRDVYERVPAAEENRLADIGRLVGQGIIETPIGAAKLRGAAAAAKAADAEASGARTAEAADQAAPGAAGEAAGAPPSDTTPAPQGNAAASGGSSWVSRVPSAEEVRAVSQAADETAAKALVEKLRPIVQLPKYDGQTSAILLTNEGRVIELKSGPPDPRYDYPAGRHAEGKAAIWIRDNDSSGGILFHNHPKGTCAGCNSNLPTLLPEGARLWVIPRADAVAPDRTWIVKPKPYDGNSARPLAPGEKR